jgi:chitinase
MKKFPLLLVLLFNPMLYSAEPRVVMYFTEWSIYDRKFHVADLPAEQITHINYAFVKIQEGKVALFDSYAAIDKAYAGDTWEKESLRGNFNQLQKLKKKHPHLKVLLSVGGWTLSSPFSDVALTEESRQKFARSAVEMMQKYAFDGLDIDWEYPVGGGLEGNKTRKEDKPNYTLLLAELRKQLDAAGEKDKKKYLLTIASPAGPATMQNMELDKIAKICDWLNLMAYDFHGSWEKVTNHHAPLYASKADPIAENKLLCVDAAVQAYLKAGVPSEKIVLGVPFYGRGWGGVKANANGLHQPATGPAPKGTWEQANWDTKDLLNNISKKAKLFRDPDSKAPWLYDEKSGVFITFDDAESLKCKGNYILEKKLGGAMIWEASGDTSDHQLLKALREGMKLPAPKK